MAIVLFALLLYMRPLAALERNSVVQSFMTVVVNSYWTRMLYVKEAADIDVHLEDATAYTVEHLGALLVAASGQGLLHAFVEHDTPGDAVDSVRSSFEHVTGLGVIG